MTHPAVDRARGLAEKAEILQIPDARITIRLLADECDRVVALNTRLTAALRVLLDAIPPGTFAGWRPYMEADQAARALLAETDGAADTSVASSDRTENT